MSKMMVFGSVMSVALMAGAAEARDKVQTVLDMPFAEKTDENSNDTRRPASTRNELGRDDRAGQNDARDVSPELNRWLDEKHPQPAGR